MYRRPAEPLGNSRLWSRGLLDLEVLGSLPSGFCLMRVFRKEGCAFLFDRSAVPAGLVAPVTACHHLLVLPGFRPCRSPHPVPQTVVLMGRLPASLHVAHLGAPECRLAPTSQTRILTDSLHVCLDDTIEAPGQMPFPPSTGQMHHIDGRCPQRWPH